MNILVICQYYKPEPFNISDVCEELVKQGNSVTVVTGVPNYPMGKIYKGYRWFKRRNENINGVNVHRCFTVGRRKGFIWRFINYFSYMISASIYVSQLKNCFDVVFVNQLSPVMMTVPAIRYKKKHGKKLVLYCLDLWPESLTAGGISAGSFIYKFFEKVSKIIYTKADKILITSKSFEKYFNDKFGIKGIHYLPQYAEDVYAPENCRKESSETVDLLFAGNIGVVQSIDTILRAAVLVSDIKNLNWHIVGDGSELEQNKNLAAKLGVNNVFFHGRKPIEEMPDFYSMADAMIVTMRADEIISKTLPAKVQTYMAAGKPIIGAADGETKKTIEEADCGFCGRAEDFEELADNVRKFISSDDKQRFSKNARNYYENNFSKEKFINDLQKHLEV